MFQSRKAFTLVEMLVALAVSSIVIIAAYASYDMVKTQYEKNIDIADTHTSGRAVMRIIERDIRMAGYEHRDSSGDKTFSTGISNQLVLTESDNACCDGVSVIYDHPTDTEDGVERRRITYSVSEFPGTEDVSYRLLDSDTARYRLYKKIDVLGRDGTILPAEESGTEQVLADFVDDLQFFNVDDSLTLYLTGTGKKIHIFDAVTRKDGSIGTIRYSTYLDDTDMTIGPDGLIYMIASRDENIYVIDPVSKTHIDTIPIKGYLGYLGGHPSIVSGPDGTLYVYMRCSIYGVNPKTKKTLTEVYSGCLGYITDMTLGSDGLIYMYGSGRYDSRGGDYSKEIQQVNPKTRTRIAKLPSGVYWPLTKNKSITAGPDGLLYFIGNGPNSRNIRVYDPIKKSTIALIPTGTVIYHPDMIFGGDGLIYLTGSKSERGDPAGSFIRIIDPVKKKVVAEINTGLNIYYPTLAYKSKKTGKKSLVNIKLTLRSKNKQHTADKTYTKEVDEEHHVGNYNFEFNDKYKRDVFFSTVAVRNMLL